MDLSTAAAWSCDSVLAGASVAWGWELVLAGASAACAEQATSIARSTHEPRNLPKPDTFQPGFIFLDSCAPPDAASYTPPTMSLRHQGNFPILRPPVAANFRKTLSAPRSFIRP